MLGLLPLPTMLPTENRRLRCHGWKFMVSFAHLESANHVLAGIAAALRIISFSSDDRDAILLVGLEAEERSVEVRFTDISSFSRAGLMVNGISFIDSQHFSFLHHSPILAHAGGLTIDSCTSLETDIISCSKAGVSPCSFHILSRLMR